LVDLERLANPQGSGHQYDDPHVNRPDRVVSPHAAGPQHGHRSAHRHQRLVPVNILFAVGSERHSQQHRQEDQQGDPCPVMADRRRVFQSRDQHEVGRVPPPMHEVFVGVDQQGVSRQQYNRADFLIEFLA
jgi:hypothetical protein